MAHKIPLPKSMANKIKYSEYIPAKHGNATLEQTTDEVRREVSVRKRLYDKWVDEGNMTNSEADARMRGMMTALRILLALPEGHEMPECEEAGKGAF